MITEREEAALNQNDSDQTLQGEVTSEVKEDTSQEEEKITTQQVETPEETTTSSTEKTLQEEEKITTQQVETPETTSSNTQTNEPAKEKEEDAHEDYSHYTKEEFLSLVKKLALEQNFRKVSPVLKEIRPLFDEIVAKEKEEAFQKFITDGGEKDGFEFREDEMTREFYQFYNKIQKEKANYFSQLEKSKEDNLQKKNDLLEKLRKLTEDEEDQVSMEELKKIQEEWKVIGNVAPQHNKSLWASYNALIDLFYNKRSIYFELKELDRKKNLALKLTLCEKAEKLVDEESIKQAIKELNELHDEFKHIGPVPKEEQEPLWQRFKTASDKVYEKKRAFIKVQEEEKHENLKKKLTLCEEIAPFAEFKSDKITEWNDKTKEVLEIQKKWDVIRFIPRDKIKDTSKKFWGSFKTFFNNKNAFIKTLDEEREGNLQAKIALCEEAEQLIVSEEEKNKIADKLKGLQRKWKEIGAVPSKHRQSIYERFKSTCDKFFEKRRERFAEQEKEYEENQKKKQALCEKITEAKLEEGQNASVVLESYLAEWKSIGFVPKKDKTSIQKQFEQALYSFIDHQGGLSEAEKEKLQVSLEVSLSKDSPFAFKKMQQKEGALKRKISKLESDISTLKNNMEFFANSKTASKLKETVEKQIEDAVAELQKLKKQLRIFKQIDR